MATFKITSVQKLPVQLEEAWNFFSNPYNLKLITPPSMDFRIIAPLHNTIYAGQLIEYTLKPVAGITVYWMTEITQIDERKYFIDEQRCGPYSLWHHQHHFKEIEGGTEMTDIVHYRNPLGVLGNIANKIFVKKQLKNIFDYRFSEIEKMFGKWPDTR